MYRNELIIGTAIGSTFGLMLDLYSYLPYFQSNSKRKSLTFTPEFSPYNTLKWGYIGLTIATANNLRGNRFAAGTLCAMGMISILPKITKLYVHPKLINAIQITACACLRFKLTRNS